MIHMFESKILRKTHPVDVRDMIGCEEQSGCKSTTHTSIGHVGWQVPDAAYSRAALDG